METVVKMVCVEFMLVMSSSVSYETACWISNPEHSHPTASVHLRDSPSAHPRSKLNPESDSSNPELEDADPVTPDVVKLIDKVLDSPKETNPPPFKPSPESIVITELAKLALVIPALPERFRFVKP